METSGSRRLQPPPPALTATGVKDPGWQFVVHLWLSRRDERQAFFAAFTRLGWHIRVCDGEDEVISVLNRRIGELIVADAVPRDSVSRASPPHLVIVCDESEEIEDADWQVVRPLDLADPLGIRL